MNTSEVYFKKAKDAIRRFEDPDEAITAIRDTLFHYLGGIPDALKFDIFHFYHEQWRETTPGTDLYVLAEAPLNLIDFITGQATDSEFADAEWEMIRDGINANADEMDIRLLNQLMAILVEKKRY
ncbi:MAG: hypothetical protein HKM05_05490 [Spirochaetales bacterium]|nr:hypothetical protein [Spirochaetales bacterium]